MSRVPAAVKKIAVDGDVKILTIGDFAYRLQGRCPRAIAIRIRASFCDAGGNSWIVEVHCHGVNGKIGMVPDNVPIHDRR